MVQQMSGITLTQAQTILNNLLEAQTCDPVTHVGSFSVEGRTVSYRSAEDLITLITFWEQKVAALTRASRGGVGPRHLLPNFSGRCR
jgi:hypothetical protein